MIYDSSAWIAERCEQLYAEIASEYLEAPGVLVRRMAVAELTERNAVLAYLTHKHPEMQGVIDAIRQGVHRP